MDELLNVCMMTMPLSWNMFPNMVVAQSDWDLQHLKSFRPAKRC